MPGVGRLAARLLAVAVAYYVGAQLGFLLQLSPTAPSILWPPNTILTAVLLVTSPRRWGSYLLAALPAHLMASLGTPRPLALVLTLFATNCSQALIAAAGVVRFSDAPARFDTLRRTTVFILAAGLAAPFCSSFLDAAAVRWFLGTSYWEVWRIRFFSNVLTELVLGPTLVMVLASGAWLVTERRGRKVEAALLAIAISVAGAWIFGMVGPAPEVVLGESGAIFLLPLVLLATVRFGPGGASAALLLSSLIAIWAGTHWRGPFADLPVGQSEAILERQVLLTAMAVPLLCLAAVIEERREAVRRLTEQLGLEVLLSRLAATCVRLSGDELHPAFQEAIHQVREATGVDCVVLYRRVTDPRVETASRSTWRLSDPDWGPGIPRGAEIPWTVDRLRGEQAVGFSGLENLPAAAARDVEGYRRHGIGSALIVPLVADPRARGALGLFSASGSHTWRDGQVHWLWVVAETFTSALARKEAEDALRASELSKSAILASLSSSVAVLNRDGQIVHVNATWSRATAAPGGPAPGEAGVGASLLQVWQRAGREGNPCAAEAASGILAVLRGERAGLTLEYASGNGTGERWFVMSVVPLDRPEGGAIVSCTDLTERKRAELDAQRSRQELAHFTRVSTMGQLTASIAHELNQPLTGILTNAQAGLRFLDAGSPDLVELRAILSDIVADDKRAGDVIQRLRDILRKSEPARVPLDLNIVVQDVVRLLGSDAIIRNVTITLDLDPRPVLVDGDRVELQQVILNLLLNAMEAMTEVASGARTVVVTTATPTTDTVFVTVQDTGPGLRPGIDDDLFEPFFTTKPSGMGMGLTIVRSIIQGQGGIIWAMNHPEGGALFQFALPASQRDGM
jgi:signal transduction histidine kinase/integral membrane sensor domain MASE1